jgi:hypothetical protein
MQRPVTLAFLGMLLAAMPAVAPPPTEAPMSVSVTSDLSVDTGMKTLLADPRAKDVIANDAPTVVEFFTSGQAGGRAPAETPLTTLA